VLKVIQRFFSFKGNISLSKDLIAALESMQGFLLLLEKFPSKRINAALESMQRFLQAISLQPQSM